VRVRVCVWERERDRPREGQIQQNWAGKYNDACDPALVAR